MKLSNGLGTMLNLNTKSKVHKKTEEEELREIHEDLIKSGRMTVRKMTEYEKRYYGCI